MENSFDYLKKPENNYPGTKVDDIRQINDLDQMVLNVIDEIKLKEIRLDELRLKIAEINIGSTNPEDTKKIIEADEIEGQILDLTIEKQLLEERKNKIKEKIGN